MKDQRKTKAQLIEELNELRRRLADDVATASSSSDTTRSGIEHLRIFDGLGDAVFVYPVDDDGRPGAFIDVNEEACASLGYSREELLGKSIADVTPSPFREKQGRRMARLLEEGRLTYESASVTGDGRLIPIEVNARTVEEGEPGDGGRRVVVISTVRDISERKAAEEALESRLRQSEVLAELSRCFIETRDRAEGLARAADLLHRAFPTFASINLVTEDGATLRMVEYRSDKKLLEFVDSTLGRPLDNWLIPLDEDTVISRTMRSGSPTVYGLDFIPEEPVVETELIEMLEAMVRLRNPLRKLAPVVAGRLKARGLLGIPFTDSRGGISGSITVLSRDLFSRDDYNLVRVAADIIGRSLAQLRLTEELYDSEERYRLLFTNLSDAVLVFPVDDDGRPGRFISVNEKACELLGYSREELLGKSIADITPRDDLESHVHRLDELVETGRLLFEIEHIAKDGRRFPVEVTAHLIERAEPDENGHRRLILSTERDIGERKAAEEKVVEERRQLLSIFNSVDEMIYIADPETYEVLYTNRKLTETMGRDCVGKICYEVFQGLEAPCEFCTNEIIKRIKPEAHHWEFHNEKLGRHFSIVDRLIRWTDDRDVRFEMAVDITEERAAQEALLRSEEKYRTLQENLPVGLFRVGLNDRILSANPALVEMMGCRTEEELGRVSVEDFYVERERRQELLQALRAEGRVTGFLARMRRSDGSEFIASINSQAVLDDDGKLLYHDGILTDVTEQALAVEALEKRIRYEEALAACSSALLGEGDPAEAVGSALRPLLEASGADRAYIFENYNEEDGGLYARQLSEVCAPGIEPQLDNPELQRVSYKDYPEWRETMAAGEILRQRTDDLPEERRGLLSSQGIRSMINIPITIGGAWEGFIGFDDCRGLLSLDDDDARLLRTAAEMLGGHFSRLRTQRSLRESENFNRSVVEHLPLGVSVREPNGRLLYCNRAWRELWAMDEAAVERDRRKREGLKFDERDGYLGESHDEIRKIYEEGGYLHLPELQVKKGRPGAVEWIEQHFYALKTEDGAVDRVVILTEDITERKRGEESLRHSEEHLSATLRSIGDAVIACDHEGRVASLNSAAERLTGWTSSEAAGLPVEEVFRIISALTREPVENPVALALKRGGNVELANHTVLLARDGSELQIADSCAPIRDSAGRVIGAVLVFRDVTEEYQRREALRLSEQRAALQRAAIAELALDQAFAEGDLDNALRRVVEVVAATLDVSRAGVWILGDDGSELRCLSLYEADKGTHDSGATLKVADFPRYFKAVMSSNRVYSEDAQNDPRTSELADIYLKPLGITSLLDAGIFVGGRLAGVVCSEHTGPRRGWHADEESFISTAASIVAQLLLNNERRRAEEALTESERTYRSLYETTLALADKTELDEVIGILVHQAGELLHARHCTYYRLDHGSDVLQPLKTTAGDIAEQVMGFPVPVGMGLTGRTAELGVGGRINIGDENRSVLTPIPDTENVVDDYESLLCEPILDGKRVIGVLTLSKLYSVFDERDQETLRIFAHMVSIAVMRAENIAALRENEETYRRVYDTTLTLAETEELESSLGVICDHATDLLGADGCIFFRYDAGRELLVPLYTNDGDSHQIDSIMGYEQPLTAGLNGRVARRRRAEFSNYTDENRPVIGIPGSRAEMEINSVISVPIMDAGELLGVLTLRAERRIFSEHDLERLKIFTRQAEIAIKRARYLDELARDEETYHRLYDTTLVLASEAELQPALEALCEQARRIMDSHFCTIFTYDEQEQLLIPTQVSSPDSLEELMGFRIRVGEGFAGLVAERRRGGICNFDDDERPIKHINGTPDDEDQFQSLISEPVLDGERLLGVITCGVMYKRYHERDLNQLRVLAHLTSIAIRRHENLKALAHGEMTYRRLYETTLALADNDDLDEALEIIGSNATFDLDSLFYIIYGYDEDENVLRTLRTDAYSEEPGELDKIYEFKLPLGQGLAGRVARERRGGYANFDDPTRKVMYINGTQAGTDHLHSVIAEPILDGERLLGVVTVGQVERVYDEADLEKLRVFSRLASIAILRARNLRDLAESEEKHRALVEQATDGIVIVQDGRIRFSNTAMESLSGYSSAEMLDTHFLDYVSPDYHQLTVDNYRRRLEGEDAPAVYEIEGVTRDGRRVPLELNTGLVSYLGQRAVLVLIRDISERIAAREALRASESRYRYLFENSTALTLILDLDGRVVDTNRTMLEQTGYAREEIVGRRVVEMVSPQSRAEVESLLEETLADRPTPEAVIPLLNSRGETRYILFGRDHAVMTSENGEVSVMITGVDITEQRLAEVERDQHRREVQAIFDNMDVMLWSVRLDDEGELYYEQVNRPFAAVEGKTPEYYNGKRIFDIATPEQYAAMRQRFELLQDGKVHNYELAFGQGKGRRYFDICLIPLPEPDGEVRWFIGTAIDVSQRQQALEALKESEERYRAFVEEAMIGVYILEEDELIFVNPQMELICGRDAGELLGMDPVQLTPEEDRPALYERRRLRGGEETQEPEFTTRLVRKSGEIRHVEVRVRPIKLEGKTVILGNVVDITERLQAEEALAESEQRYRSIWTKSPIGICLTNREGALTIVNPSLSRMLGFEEGELEGRRFFDLILAEEGSEETRLEDILDHTLDTQSYRDEFSMFSGRPTELRMTTRDGRTLPVEVTVDFISLGGSVQYMIALVNDITERKRAEQALANYRADLEREVAAKTEQLSTARRYLRDVIDSSGELITVCDAEGCLEIINRTAAQALGYTEYELLGESISILYYQKDQSLVEEMGRRMSRGHGTIVTQVDIRSRGGSPIPVELSISPIHDHQGTYIGSVGIGRDTREFENMRKALLQSEKLAAAGKLAASIAHEVNNPLGVIKNYLQIAKMDFDPAGENYRLLGIIEEEIQRIARIIKGLLDFYRPESTSIVATSLNRLIEDLLLLVGRQLEKSNIEVVTELDDELPTVRVSPDLFRQIILNMITNAQDSMPEGGTLRLETLVRDDRVIVRVGDTGTGISNENLPYIFDPFFTTKGNRGTGLGLSISYGIVRSFEGEIKVQSEPGRGSTFTIQLPLEAGTDSDSD